MKKKLAILTIFALILSSGMQIANARPNGAPMNKPPINKPPMEGGFHKPMPPVGHPKRPIGHHDRALGTLGGFAAGVIVGSNYRPTTYVRSYSYRPIYAYNQVPNNCVCTTPSGRTYVTYDF